MSAIDPRLPFNASEWNKLFQKRGLSTAQTSASKVGHEGFLSLRALWKHHDGADFSKNAVIPGPYFDKATDYLSRSEPFLKYLSSIEHTNLSEGNEIAQDIGAYSLVYYFQQQVLRVGTMSDEDTEKVFFTPVTARTRSKKPQLPIHQYSILDAECPGAEDSPVPKRKKLSSKLKASITKRGNSSSAASFENSSTQTSEPRSLIENFKKLSIKEGIGIGEWEGEEGKPRTPESSRPTQGTSVLPAMSPASPFRDVAVPAARDEQIVNTALVLLLSSLTMYHPEVRAEWTLHRRGFQLSKWLEARTDGFLRGGEKDTPLVILEVKASWRERRKPYVQFQESAQMAAWIYEQKNRGHLPTEYRDGKDR